MAKIKPIIRRCLFCGETFTDASLQEHYKDTRKPLPQSKSNCLSTYELYERGWLQQGSGYWVKP